MPQVTCSSSSTNQSQSSRRTSWQRVPSITLLPDTLRKIERCLTSMSTSRLNEILSALSPPHVSARQLPASKAFAGRKWWCNVWIWVPQRQGLYRRTTIFELAPGTVRASQVLEKRFGGGLGRFFSKRTFLGEVRLEAYLFGNGFASKRIHGFALLREGVPGRRQCPSRRSWSCRRARMCG